MRAAIENWLLGHWYGEGRPPFYLEMLEPVYRLAFKRDQNRKRNDAFKPSTPLIVVGNITAGGTGKTPLVIALCEIAGRMGLKAGIACTGYGRQSRETLLVKAESNYRDCGDEPVLLAQRTACPVVVAACRVDAARVLDDMQLDLLISDDGLQQADLGRDIEICVVDGSRGFGNGHLIPAGPMREPGERINRVDHVVSNGQWSDRPAGLEVHLMQFRTRDICSLDGKEKLSPEGFLKKYPGKDTHAVAGTGNPKRFFSTLEKLGIQAITHVFPDHHDFTRRDFDSIESGAAIIMTEKDAVKCRSLGLQNAWFLAIDARLPKEFEQLLQKQIGALTKERK